MKSQEGNTSKFHQEYPYPFSLIRPKTLASSILGISLSTLYERMKDDDSPPKVKLSSGAVGFKRSDVEAYINSKTETNERE